MTTIELVANDQLLQVTVNPTISSGEQNTVEVHVDFSDDWDGFSKSAVFFTSLNKNAIYEIVMTDGKCIVPAEVMEKECMLFIGVRGVNSNNNEVKTTSLVKYKISEGTPTGNSTEVEPTPDVYQQLLTAYGKTGNSISKEISDRKSAITAEENARKLADANEKAERQRDIANEKAERQAEIAVERARIDNLSTLTEGSTTADAELLDIRVKADGTTATSAGNAVREQFSELKGDLEDVNSKIDYNKTAMSYGYNSFVDVGEWELGMIYNGNNIARDYSIRTKEKVHINENMMVYDLDSDNFVWIAVQYSSDGTFEKNSTVNSAVDKVFEFDTTKLYRFVIRSKDGTTPITDIYKAKNSIKFFYENDLFNEFAKKTVVDSDIADLKNYKIQAGEYELVYKNQLELRINQINDKSKEIGTNGDMFIFITDMHNPYTPFEDKPLHHRQNLRAIPLIKKVLECTPCNKVFVGGDLAFSSLSDNNTRELAYNQCRTVVNRFNELIDAPVYFIKGNHDDNGYTDETYYTDNQLYPLFNACLEKDKDVTWGDRNKLYWYVDNPIAKIRYICLNTFPRKSDGTQSLGMENDQKSWLKDVALNIPNTDWVAVILAHKIHWNVQEIAKEKMDSGVTVAFCLGGHEHIDTFIPYTDMENGKGVNFVQTTCDACYAEDGYGRRVGTDFENAFDVVTIDKTQRKIVMYRIGAGDIRSFYY